MAIGGCNLPSSVTGSGQVHAPGKTFASQDSITPDALPYTNARLLLAGTEVKVTMTRRASPGQVIFDLSARDVVLESEKYLSDDKAFSFVGLSDETFQPAIPLVVYPFSIGDDWTWSGTANLGPNSKPAEAKLTCLPEKLNLPGGVYDCVLVTADVIVQASRGVPSKRTLKFWFQPKSGLVKREFGFSSTREPASVQ
jgi:hypothetical protein